MPSCAHDDAAVDLLLLTYAAKVIAIEIDPVRAMMCAHNVEGDAASAAPAPARFCRLLAHAFQFMG
jgi:hypothetical protein